ncbi:MAG TPA: sensor histidine kinase [Verrucomicrobiae bacterium]|nr:sensor histidine kinase [Verrucomicrobiae bacterium]
MNSLHLALLLPALAFSISAQNAASQNLPSPPPLMSVRQLREVAPDQAAKQFPVRLRGVITFCDARVDVGMFIKDATGGIYVKLGEGTNNFAAGDEVEVIGRSGAGDFVPIIIAERVNVFDHATLPAPDRITYDQLATGVQDGQWVELRGTVRAVVPAVQGHTLVEFLVDGQRLSALVTHFDLADGGKLIGSVASVRGVCRTRFNNRRQIRAPFLSVTSSDNITVEKPAPRDVIKVPLAQLFRFNSGSYYGHRVQVEGVVTEQKGGSIFIQDQGEGLSVKTHQTNVFVPGDIVSVVGFPAVGHYSPVLEDSVVRQVLRGAPPAPVNVRPDDLLSEDYDGELVRLRARLVNHVQRGDEQVLVLEAENMILSARVDSVRAAPNFGDLQIGSELDVTGVCMTQPTENWNPSVQTKPESFQLLLRSSNDVTVIRNPPWWTLSRLLFMLATMSVVLLAGFAWVFVLDRRVRQQTAIIQQKLQREAVLEERTRIAREFHDTLEQELVAITIQLETVADQFEEAPQVARQMLDLARNMTRRSLFEARRSVWDLRSHLLENSTLVNAVQEVAKLMSASSRVPISVGTSGSLHKLPAQVENNLLRITQEALANALKHARATEINVNLSYDPGKVCLRIQDDGIGFDTNNSTLMYAGHFGLLDMSERTEKMGGTFSVVSIPRQGTEIIIEYMEKDDSLPGETDSLREVDFPAARKTEIA